MMLAKRKFAVLCFLKNTPRDKLNQEMLEVEKGLVTADFGRDISHAMGQPMTFREYEEHLGCKTAKAGAKMFGLTK
jgi:hypothetical protein